MTSVGLVPALALMAGAVAGTFSNAPFAAAWWLPPVLCAGAVVAWWRRAPVATLLLLGSGFVAAGGVLAAEARDRALHSTLRGLLDDALGGFAIEGLGPEADHDPLLARAELLEDAAARDGFVAVRARVTAVVVHGDWHEVDGGVSLSVSGAAAADHVLEWRAGRRIEAPIAFRRPARYLNDGVPDLERDLALAGTTLFGSIKSALLVDIVAPGTRLEEAAADVRAYVRRAVTARVARHGEIAGAIVTAVLIGDRTGLPADVRDRLQAAGTYHVIAISGGNIAILAGLILGVLMLASVQGRGAALAAIVLLLAYSQVATAGPSVWRATLMAVLYLGARLLDHRTAPWQAAAVAAALMIAAHPLDVRDPGFILTFGATAALLEGARRGHALLPRHRGLAWLTASIAASLATEIALVPVSAQTFSRVTSAGLVLNLIAVPMMGVAQIAGIAATALDSLDAVASAAGWVAYAAATTLVESARLVEIAPWLASRVPPPGVALVLAYYLALVAAVYARRPVLRLSAAMALAACLVAIGGGLHPFRGPPAGLDRGLRWTMFDVGQGEALLVQLPGVALQIDTGGAPFGGAGFAIGPRVLAPALWARGVRALDALLVTHGDPDHLGGARVLLEEFAPGRLWEGVEVPSHAPTRELRDAAAARGVRLEARRAGEAFDLGGARVRVLHPPAPDWERPRIRNDDSVVLEIVYGDVALLLTGDAGEDVERAILPRLTPARTRILKVGHHGSRTSTSQALLDAWRPQLALISAGRGNTFGHPAPEVLQRLEQIGARIYRTDRHGQITVDTDGERVEIRTYVSHQEH